VVGTTYQAPGEILELEFFLASKVPGAHYIVRVHQHGNKTDKARRCKTPAVRSESITHSREWTSLEASLHLK
jgi:hypothetical protein